jgi:hypothetical protein
MNTEEIKKDLEELEKQYDQAMASLNAISGAIQYAKGLISRLEAPTPDIVAEPAQENI